MVHGRSGRGPPIHHGASGPTRELVTRGGSWRASGPFMGTHLKVLEALGDGGPTGGTTMPGAGGPLDI